MESKLQQFIAQESGQIVSFDGIPADAGQCVQLVSKWCQFIGLPVEWANAAAWFLNETSAFSQKWTKVVNNPNDPNQLPSPGDLVCFAPSLPGSDGYGHIDIFVKDLGNHEWQGFDCNWNGKNAKLVTHNWAYVMGWYTPNVPVTPPPAPATPLPSTGSSAPNTHAVANAGFNVSIPVKGYASANDAANHINWDGKTMVAADDYNIFNEYKGMVNVTTKQNVPGSWINPEDEKPAPAPAAPVVNHDTPKVEPGTTDVNETVTITSATLNVREDTNTNAPAHEANTPDGSLHQGNVIQITAWVHGENVTGNDIWLRTVRGNWVWSGGTNFDLNQTKVAEVKPADPAPAAPVVKPQMVNNVAAAMKGDPVKVTVNPWQDSYKPSSGTFKLISDVTITDLANDPGHNPVIAIKGTIVDQAGTFIKDGVKYARTDKSVQNNVWYGVPADQLVPVQNPAVAGKVDVVKPASGVTALEDDIEDGLDDIFKDISNEPDTLLDSKLHGKDAIVADFAKAESFVGKLFNKKKG